MRRENNKILIIILLFVLQIGQEEVNGYIKSKQIDCGHVEIDEEFSLENTNHRLKKLDSPKVLISNLSDCLRNLNEYNYTSFSAFLSSKEAAKVFELYFDLDASSGLVFQKRKIDRELLCVEAKVVRVDRYSSSADTALSPINCDCRSEKCELNFKFIGFKDKSASSSSSSSLGKRRRIQHLQTNTQEYKYLDLSVRVRDLNDQRPKFQRNFLYLNTSEQFGNDHQQQSSSTSKNHHSNTMPVECASLKVYHKTAELNLNSLISLEKAYDLDVGKNAHIRYKLVLLSNQSSSLIEDLESELDDDLRLRRVKELLSGGNETIRPCFGLFELAENVRFSNDDYYNEEFHTNEYESGKDSNSKRKANKLSGGGILKEQLFLKINTYLDREIQQVYNFILIASEAASSESESRDFKELLNKENFLLISLRVTDLNDHQPKFDEPKYIFHISEATEYKAHYSKRVQSILLNEKNSSFYYATLLNESCHRLREIVRVKAYDADEGLNALVKYKITQKNHLKNPSPPPNTKQLPTSSMFQMLKDDLARVRSYNELNSNHMFYINEQTGEIYLLVCKLIEEGRINKNEINREKFLEYTSLLDYESYMKHILVIEASDSNPNTPLQSVVTLEINLSDLNDNRPQLVDLYSRECSSSKFSVDPLLYSPSSSSSSLSSTSQEFTNPVNISIVATGERTQIVIRGLTENTPSGRCLGQFSVNDLDTPFQNRRLEANLRLKNPSHDHLDTGFIFTNLKTRGGGGGGGELFLFRLHHPNEIYYEIEPSSSGTGGIVYGRNMTDSSTLLSDNALPTQTSEIFELYLNFEPDAERQSVHELDLELRDMGQPLGLNSHIDLVVYIDDVNDNFPKFAKLSYNFSIDEWNELESSSSIVKKTVEQAAATPATSVCLGKIEAVDNDVTQENSAILYSLVETDSSTYRLKKKKRDDDITAYSITPDEQESNFYVNANTGHICVKNPRLLDREKKSRYDLLIKASNKNPSIYSTVPCHISIRDVNDNRPEFLNAEYRFYVAEKDSNLVVSNIIFDDQQQQWSSTTRSPYSMGRSSGAGRHGHKKRTMFTMTYVGSVRATDRDATSDLVYYLDAANSQSYIELNTAATNPISLSSSSSSEAFLTDQDDHDAHRNNNDQSYDFVDFEFSDNAIYEVTAIKGFISDQHNSSLSSSSAAMYASDEQNEFVFNYTNFKDRRKKELKLVENISEYIYVNSTTGAIYLRKNIDREKILNIRFTLFVRDKKTPGSGSLTNQVEVIIEFIDINDSKPECFSSMTTTTTSSTMINSSSRDLDTESTVEMIINSSGSSEEKLLIDVFSIRIDLDKIASLLVTSSTSRQYRLAKIYKFMCIDNDLNKNARLKYEIKNYYLRNIDDSNRLVTTTTGASNRWRKSKSKDEIEQLINVNKIFIIEPNSGVLFLNLTQEWTSWDSDLIKSLLNLVEKKFLVIRVRVSDHGIVPLYRDYFLRFYLCLADSGDRDLADRLCDFGSERKNRTILIKPLSFDSISRYQLNSDNSAPWYEAVNGGEDNNNNNEEDNDDGEKSDETAGGGEINDSSRDRDRDLVYDEESFGHSIAKTEIFNNDDDRQNSAIRFSSSYMLFLTMLLLVILF